MLSLIHIENIAVIEKADICLDAGFNVMTGETGAGKSIVIDAIGAVLGERTPRDIVRTGASSALVSAVFVDLPTSVCRKLEEIGLSADEAELMIQREMFLDGRNVCRINGLPVTVSVLKNMGSILVNVHGQHDSQQLLNDTYHIVYLDSFAGTEKELENYRLSYSEMKAVEKEISSLTVNESEKARMLDMLRFQISEIQQAELLPGEDTELITRRNVLKNSVKIVESVDTAYYLFFGGDESEGVQSELEEAVNSLSQVTRYSEELAKIHETLSDLRYNLLDVSEQIRDVRNSLEFSPDELEQIEWRLDIIYKLKQKYGASVDEILQYLEDCRIKEDSIEFSEQRLETLQKEYEKRKKDVSEKAGVLTMKREKASQKLETRIMEELQQLDMGKIRFSIEITRQGKEGQIDYSEDGADNVRFLISTNVGEPLKPLSRIASGGELSRIMLAMKNVLAENDDVGTLIFDEVDSGVSGRAAQRVAEKLCSVSKGKQVLCVTHLAQIASMADSHFYIDKTVIGERTSTMVNKLSPEQRTMEIARIIGGARITDITRQSARELIESAQNWKMKENQ